MKRKFLVAAVALSPLLAAIAGQVHAQVSITSSTSAPIATATANNGAPANIDVAGGGSIGVTAPGAAITINSSNSVTVEGALGFTNIDNATGALILGGNNGSFVSTGSITVTETYTDTLDPNNDGLNSGHFASGKDRIGIDVAGPGIFTGGITSAGSILVQGNNSEGIYISAPITGSLLMETVTGLPITSSTTVRAGSITVTGNNTTGLEVTPGGGVGGNVTVAGVTARGYNAQGVNIAGAVGGFVNISGAVSATGYETTTRSTIPAISVLYGAQEMQQGGAAATIGGSIGGGLILSTPPLPLSTTNLDQDGDGVPDALQGAGSLTSYGAAPALQIGGVAVTGGTAPAITIGAYSASKPVTPLGQAIGGYGVAINGAVTANGVFDQLTSPFLPGPVAATAIQIGGQILVTPEFFTTTGLTTVVTPAVYAPSGSVTIAGGLYNSGAIQADSYQADATAIHIGAGATVPAIVNDGQITALSIQVNSLTTVTPASGSIPAVPAPAPVNVTAIQIDSGAVVNTITNTAGIIAELTGEGGPAGNVVTGIIDKSGSVTTVNNSGSILAELNQTLASSPMQGATTAIDISSGTAAQAITQTISPNAAKSSVYNPATTYAIGAIVSYVNPNLTYAANNIYIATAAVGLSDDPVDDPALWREVGALTPSIAGDIHFGSGPDTLDVEGGTVITSANGLGHIDMGGGLNTIIVNTPTVAAGATAPPPSLVAGYFTETGGGQFAINVESGTLSDSNPNTAKATSVNVGASGILLVAADPANHTFTQYQTTGASTFQNGAQVGLNFLSLQTAPVATYTILQTVGGGVLTTGTFGSGAFNNAPFLYTATASSTAGSGQLDLTVTQRTPAQLGFDKAEGSALEAVLAAIPANQAILRNVLSQTTQAGLKGAFDQLLPSQGLGVFESIDAAAQKISAMTGTTPDAGAQHVGGGNSLWLQEVNERVDRSDNAVSLGSNSKLLGLVGGFEHMGQGGGAIGLTLSYMNVQEQDADAAVGEHVVASLVEAGAYYRRNLGAFSFSARGAGGYAWFDSDRSFIAPGAFDTASARWGGEFIDAHAQVTYEVSFGRFYARPEISADYLRLHQDGHTETGGGTGFDLVVDPSSSSRLSGQAILVLGTQYGKGAWLRPEIYAGYREIFAGQVGDTVASFAGGGDPFTMSAENDSGGWMTVGFSIKGGTPYSYVALEGDADFRSGEQRYDLRVAGRSMF